MSGSATIPNYRDTVFEYSDLTVIHGEPTYDTLKLLVNQLKANARSVRTTLGGGNHGYLGLVLSPQQYAIIAPGTPFIHPAHPGPLNIPPYQLPHVTQQAQSHHAEQVRLYNECYNVKQALHKQIIAAIQDSYIAALKNHQTNTITTPLYQVIEYLFRNYGRVTPAQLVHEEQQVTNWTYDTTMSIVILFNKIDDLMDLANATGSPYSAQQIINFGYILLNKTSKFSQGIREWNRLQPAQKTWDTFQTHFTNEYQALRETGELTDQESTFNTANIIQEVVDGVQQALQPTADDIDETSELIHEANLATAQTTQQTELMQQMLQMIQSMQNIQCQLVNSAAQVPNNSQRRNTRIRRNISKYCWTHGACSHWGKDCRNKKPGHSDDATFNDRKGDSTAYIRSNL